MLDADAVDQEVTTAREENPHDITASEEQSMEGSLDDLFANFPADKIEQIFQHWDELARAATHAVGEEEPTVPATTGLEPKVKKSALADYYQYVVFDAKSWNLLKPMPRKSRDKEFDKLLVNLGLEEN